MTVSKVTNPQFDLCNKEMLGLANVDYIMLNPWDDGYRRLLKVNVDETSVDIETIIPPDLNSLDFANRHLRNEGDLVKRYEP